MDKKIVLWIVIGVLVIAVAFVTVKALSVGNVQAAVSSGQAVSSAGSGMVGGC